MNATIQQIQLQQGSFIGTMGMWLSDWFYPCSLLERDPHGPAFFVNMSESHGM